MDDIPRISRELGEHYKRYSGLYSEYTQWFSELPPYFYEYLHEELYEGRTVNEILKDIDESLERNYSALFALANDVQSLAYAIENPG